jgi:hypothetical protein
MPAKEKAAAAPKAAVATPKQAEAETPSGALAKLLADPQKWNAQQPKWPLAGVGDASSVWIANVAGGGPSVNYLAATAGAQSYNASSLTVPGR